MGYSTDFTGKISIEPPLDEDQVEFINQFCETRHGGNVDVNPGKPGLWCDWEVSGDGRKIYWNESEKSYQMDDWIRYLIENFFRDWGLTLNGRLLAQGERQDDVWILEVRENSVSRIDINREKMFDITE